MSASKGYSFVPLPEAVNREVRPQARFDRRTPGCARLALELQYRAVQPIHVGAGHWTLDGRLPVRQAARSGERPAIPGSSMKGVLRARYEAITKSCCVGRAPRDRKLDNKLPSQTFPEYTVRFDPKIAEHEVFVPCKPKSGKLCPACALFGAMSLRGRVAVHDLLAPEGTELATAKLPERFSPRPHHLGKFDEEKYRKELRVTELKGRKFYRGVLGQSEVGRVELVETIPAGTELQGKIVCTNITAAELGGLLSALGFTPSMQLRVGAGKAYPFGRLDAVRVGIVPGAGKGDFPDGFLDRARSEFEASADRHDLGERWLMAISKGSS